MLQIQQEQLKLVSELNNKEDAAIASDLAAKIYNLKIIESNFQDTNNNVTRFLIMSKKWLQCRCK